MEDYEILEVTFSLDTRVEEKVQTTYLVAHISFLYTGIYNHRENGSAIKDVAVVCTATLADDGKYQSFSQEEMPTYDDIMDQVKEEVEAQVASLYYKDMERSCRESYLGKINSLTDSEGNHFPLRFAQKSPVYNELDNWNTGIGADTVNFINKNNQ